MTTFTVTSVTSFFCQPSTCLFAHRLKVPLHSAHTNRDAIDEPKRLRVLRQHGREHAGDNVSKCWLQGSEPAGRGSVGNQPQAQLDSV